MSLPKFSLSNVLITPPTLWVYVILLPLLTHHKNLLSSMKLFKHTTLIIFKLKQSGRAIDYWLRKKKNPFKTYLCFSKKSISLLNFGVVVNVKILAYFGQSNIQLFLCKQKRRWEVVKESRFQGNKKILIPQLISKHITITLDLIVKNKFN